MGAVAYWPILLHEGEVLDPGPNDESDARRRTSPAAHGARDGAAGDEQGRAGSLRGSATGAAGERTPESPRQTGRAHAGSSPDARDGIATSTTLEGFLAGVERRAFVMARLATRNRDEALDIVQDAMFALVRSYSNRSAQEWAPLFHTILQSRIRDWHRRNAVRNRWRAWLGRADAEDDSDPLLNLPDPRAAGPGEQLDNRRGLAALEAALTRLPPRQQQAFLLRVWEGLDVAGTARAMRCSEGSVKTHLSRAVQTLREELKEHWPYE